MDTRNSFHFNGIVLTLLLWFTGIVIVPAQDYLFDAEIISVEDGLPHRMTYDVVQDKEGFIWVNTQGAISRYDGYNFKTYNASFLHISENRSARLAIDAANLLWYCETNATTPVSGIINTDKDSIYSMETISKGLFTSKEVVYLDNATAYSDDILIVTRAGIIYRYNGSFEEIYRLPEPVSEHIVLCKANPDGSYWIVHGEDLFKVKNKKVLKTINTGMKIRRIVSTSPELILSTYSKKYQVLKHDSLVPFSIPPHDPEEMKGVFQLHKDYNCYATKDALLVRDPGGKLLYHFDVGDTSRTIIRLMAYATMVDRQNILWAATEYGIVKLTAKKNPFEILLPNNSMRAIFKDVTTLWVGQINHRFFPDEVIGEEEYMDYVRNDAMSFYKDLRGHIWIGTRLEKVVEYIPEEDRYIHYDFGVERNAFQFPFQNPLTQNYWIGTSIGLFRFDITTKKATPFPLAIPSEGVNIRQVYQNEQGIWLVSSKGIFLMDAEKETIVKHYTTADGLPTNSIIHIHEDDAGIFWLGTKDAGLVRWNRQNKNFRQYSRENELSNNKIYAVYEDDFETLWLPSDYGLMAFDKNTETTRVYLPKDGIAHEEFNYFSHFQDTDGTLYFGGLNGITKFHPAALRENSHMEMPLYATRVSVLEKDAETFSNRTKAFKTAKKIVLSPNDRILELELTLLDYEKSAENQYAYKLEGKQEQWLYTRENKLSIINPPYGKYDLVIKARGASGSWSEKPFTIPMHVKPPFYMQWWFILTSVLLTITIIIIAVRWRVQKLQKDRQRLEAEVQKRTRKIEADKITIEAQAEELKVLDKAKTRFFSNITHEFRTPLTLVKGPVEQMIAQPPPPATLKKRLSGVLKNTDNLLELINQLLDMSKLEGGRMQLEVAHGDIIRYTRELVARFQPMAAKKKVQLDFTAHAGNWKTHFDSDKWTKILYNLLSNALKFTPENGSVTVHLAEIQQAQQECIQLTVQDTGIGIEAGQLAHIFDRFYQADASATRTAGGTGIGLALVKELAELQNGSVSVSSTPGEGTTFTVILPVLPATEEASGISVPEVTFPITDEAEAAVENERETVKDQGETEKLELLIVEDHPGMRAYIRSCINISLYNITEAGDGQEGIAKAQEIIPDLIISDVMMPQKDGFELTHAIRNHLATSHIPLILLTAKASLESRLKGLERGADAYLTKPFNPEELALRIQKLIAIRQLLRERYQNFQLPEEERKEFQKEDSFITTLKAYITDHMSEPDLSITHISRYFAMSRMQLHRKLKALVNTSATDYIRSVRLETAVQLLKERQLNITEIAYETGFSSGSHFSRAFKKFYGKKPSEI